MERNLKEVTPLHNEEGCIYTLQTH